MFTQENIKKALNHWLDINNNAVLQIKQLTPNQIELAQATLLCLVTNIRFLMDMAGNAEEFDKELGDFKVAEETAQGMYDYILNVCEFCISRHKMLIDMFNNEE